MNDIVRIAQGYKNGEYSEQDFLKVKAAVQMMPKEYVEAYLSMG